MPAADKKMPWRPYNQVIKLDLHDARVIKEHGVYLSNLGEGYIEHHLEEAMIIADSEIARMIKWRLNNE